MIINKHLLLNFYLVTNYKKDFFSLIFAILGSAISVLLLGHYIRLLVDANFDNINVNEILGDFLIILSIISILCISIYLRSKSISQLSDNIDLELKKQALQKLINYNGGFFDKFGNSNVLISIENDINAIKSSITIFFSFFLRNLILILGGVVLIFYTNLQLAVTLLLIFPVVIMPVIWLVKKLKNLSQKAIENKNNISIFMHEVIQSIRVIQAYNNQNLFLRKSDAIMSNYRKDLCNKNHYRALIISVLIFLISLSIMLVVWFGIKGVLKGEISSGSLVSFMYYAIIIAAAFTGMSDVFTDLVKASHSAQNFNEILNYDSKKDFNITDGIFQKDEAISFNNVNFSYGNKKILENLNFSVKKGEVVAIVGQSGSGKSTILSLILGFYNVTKGSIFCNAIEVCDSNIYSVREIVAYVSQEPRIFTGNFKENVEFGMMGASEEDIIKALKDANLYDEVQRDFQNSIYSSVGISGNKLSYGQKQRLEIARAFLKKPRILLLDEATSNLDSKNEQEVVEAINKLMLGKTTIIVTHRLNILKNIKKVIVINEGKIVDIDTHENLLKKGGLYYQLYLAGS